MTLSSIINIVSIFSSPLVALQVQKYLNDYANKKRRKEEIFNTLMETRAQPLSFEHVRALNKIDLAFYKDKHITSSWNSYRDHLNKYPKDQNKAHQEIWVNQITDKLITLLLAMSKLLKYDFDDTALKNGAYLPLAHGNLEMEQAIVRKGLVELFSSQKPLEVNLMKSTINSSTSE